MAEKHAAVLARLTELGLALAERTQERAMAAEDPKVAADQAITFHRVARGVRQTIALEARLAREVARAEREAEREAARQETEAAEAAERAANDRPRDFVRIAHQRKAVHAAVEKIIWDECDREDAAYLCDLLPTRLGEAVRDPKFELTSVEQHIARFCADFGLPLPEDWPPPAPGGADQDGRGPPGRGDRESTIELDFDSSPPIPPD